MAFISTPASSISLSSSLSTSSLLSSTKSIFFPPFRSSPQNFSQTISIKSHKRQRVNHFTPSTTSSIMMIAEGQKAPSFTAEDIDGNKISLSSFKGKNLVLYFSNAGGAVCNAQSSSFRDAVSSFDALNAKVVAVAARNKYAANSFRDTNRLNFPVIPDENGTLQKLYDVPSTLGLLPGRVTFVIDKDGIVRKVFNAQLSSSEHVRVAKDTLTAIQK